MARRRHERAPRRAVEPEWRHRWLCRAPFLSYGASTLPHDVLVDLLRVAIERIEDGGGSIERRSAAIEAVLAEYGVLELVERRIAFLWRARIREGDETLAEMDLLADSRQPAARGAL